MGDIKRIGLRMPMSLYCKVEEISRSYGIAVAGLINFIVAQWVDNQLYVRDRLINELRDVLVSREKDADL